MIRGWRNGETGKSETAGWSINTKQDVSERGNIQGEIIETYT